MVSYLCFFVCMCWSFDSLLLFAWQRKYFVLGWCLLNCDWRSTVEKTTHLSKLDCSARATGIDCLFSCWSSFFLTEKDWPNVFPLPSVPKLPTDRESDNTRLCVLLPLVGSDCRTLHAARCTKIKNQPKHTNGIHFFSHFPKSTGRWTWLKVLLSSNHALRALSISCVFSWCLNPADERSRRFEKIVLTASRVKF